MNAVLADEHVDVVLVLFSPQAIVSADDVANEIIAASAQYRKTVLAVLGGGPSAAAARIKLDQARIPQFLSTENAVDAIGFWRRSRAISRCCARCRSRAWMVSCRALTTRRSFSSTSGLKAVRCYTPTRRGSC